MIKVNEEKIDGFYQTMQKKVAVSAVGPSALRGQGKGILKISQDYLSTINLAPLSTFEEKSFRKWIDRCTKRLLDLYGISPRPWGTARKAINLFLRDALYKRYLCSKFNLEILQPWLEIPLDSAVAKGLKKTHSLGILPVWPRLKHLTKPISNIYQNCATELASQKAIDRVHLDMYLWLENR